MSISKSDLIQLRLLNLKPPILLELSPGDVKFTWLVNLISILCSSLDNGGCVSSTSDGTILCPPLLRHSEKITAVFAEKR